MNSLKCIWGVSAGVVPGIPIDELSKSFTYNSVEYERDKNTGNDQETRFVKAMLEAHDYAKSLTNPKSLNWVKIEWMWM